MTANADFDNRIAQRLADPLSAAREAARAGRRVIGYVSAEAPVELILAANALPVRLRGAPDAPTPRADEFLESAFVPEMRTVAEQWLSGALDCLDAVIFPRTNDSAQRLYYYVCEFQRRGVCKGPKPLLFDIATIARTTSFEHTLSATQKLAETLGTDMALLPHAMERVARRAITLPGSFGLRVRRAAEFDWNENFDALLARQVTQTSNVERVVLAGSSPPDERLHVAVEAAGGVVIRDFTETTSFSTPATATDGGNAGNAGAVFSAAGGELERGHLHTPDAPAPTLPRGPGDGVLETLAHRYHHTATPAQRMLRSPTWLVDEARASQAAGVILWLIEEDEALPWEVAHQIAALKHANIPVLALTRQRWLADANTLKTIGEFVRGLERQP